MKRNLIIGLHILLLVFVMGYFWSQSRYPALDNKAYYGDRNRMTGLSFDQVVAKRPTDSWPTRVYASTVNWYYTNWKGMTFGLIFAALLLSLFGFLRIPQFKNRWLSSASGMVFGAPLGVCVNCATPIGQGLEKLGLRPEFVLSSTLSSPTLNIVVITMLLTNFPLHLALIKIVATALLVLIIVPLLSPKSEPTVSPTEPLVCNPAVNPESYAHAFKLFLTSLWTSSKRILILTFPLMALSGLLGAIVIESIQLETSRQTSFLGMLGISAIGTALPVPMTFDVVLAHKLLESDMPTSYVTVLLVTLGSFSIYPFLVFARTYSWRFAVSLATAVVVLGTMAGFASESFEYQIAKQNEQRFLASVNETQDQVESAFRNIISKHCTGFRKDDCILNSVAKIATLGSFADLCLQIGSSKLAVECKYVTQFQNDHFSVEQCGKSEAPQACMIAFFRSFRKLAPTLAPEAECSQQKSSSPLCQEVRNLSWAVRVGNLPACFTMVENPTLRVGCIMSTAIMLWEKFGLPGAREACSKLDTNELHDECLINVFVAAEHDEGCSEIPGLRLQCLARIALLDRIDDVTEESLCATLPAENPQSCHETIRPELTSYLLNRELDTRRLSKVSLNLKSFQDKDRPSSNSLNSRAGAWEVFPQSLRVDSTQGKTTVSSFPFHPRNPQTTKQFARLWMQELGVQRAPIQAWESLSFSRGFGVTSGDINGDGWPDLVIGEPNGLSIYTNHEGKFFDRLAPPKFSGAIVPVNVALVDFNNDGLDDLYLANFDGRIFIVENDGHGFDNGVIHELPKSSRGWAVAATFGDFNKDGLIDIFVGNTGAFAPNEKNYLTDQYQNEIFFGGPKFTFTKKPWQDSRGATLSVLASDINDDGNLDLLEGNDFTTTDYIWLGDGKGSFKKILKSDGVIPVFTWGSMGFDTADFDNDLKVDIFSAGNGRQPEAHRDYCQKMKSDGLDDTDCRQIQKLNQSIRLQFPSACDRLFESRHRMECYAGILSDLAHRMHSTEACERIPDDYQVYKHRCLSWFEPNRERREEDPEDIPQKFAGNILLRGLGSGKFEEIAVDRGVDNSAWAWSSKFADVDNDGWQDLYSTNGRNQVAGMSQKVLFKNDHGKFKRFAVAMGLEDLYDASSFVFIDYDLDGDLDIISNGVLVPQRLFRNGLQKGNSLSFSFDDRKGNRAGIGNRVIIRYQDENGQPLAQLRELKLGGGYASYDPKSLHFGVGEARKIDSVEVRWSTGETTLLNKGFSVGRHFVIKRE